MFSPHRSSSSLLYLQDTLSSTGLRSLRFSISAPASSSHSCIHLVTANESAMNCSGSRIIPLQLRSRHYKWTFQLAPVSIPILRDDFLRHPRLLGDFAGDFLFKPSDPCLQANPCQPPLTLQTSESVLRNIGNSWRKRQKAIEKLFKKIKVKLKKQY